MATRHKSPETAQREHSVPWFWPMAAGIELGAAGLELFDQNLRFMAENMKLETLPAPAWATVNRVSLDLDTMRLRDFSLQAGTNRILPVIIDAPYAGHSATIADYAPGQSLVETLQAAGMERLLVTDWKSATESMKDYDIDKYLAELNVAVDDLGGLVNLVGLCQGGWMCTMYAARFPRKVKSLVLAGSPIDTNAGKGEIRRMAHELPMSFYENIVRAGAGLMPGKLMLAGWKSMHPDQQYVDKYLDLYTHIENRNYIKRTETFERWYENPIDLPGKFYLQAVSQLFKENSLAKGAFMGLGRRLDLKSISAPVYLLAGESDDITTPEQVFAAEQLVGTPGSDVVKKLVPGGHIGLFMGTNTLANAWPGIGDWIVSNGKRG